MNWPGWKYLALLLVLALAVRFAAAWVWQQRLARTEQRFIFGDSETYWQLAQAIAEGQPYECGREKAKVFRTPGYPLLLAGILRISGKEPSPWPARLQNAVMGTLAVAGVWWLGKLLFDERTGLIAAAIAALYPGAITVSVLVLSEASFCVLMIGQLALWTLAWTAASARRAGVLAASAGLIAAAATLIRPSWLLFTPLAVVVGLAVGARGSSLQPSAVRRPSKAVAVASQALDGLGRTSYEVFRHSGKVLRHLVIGAAMLTGLVVAMTPWWIRNARLTGHFVPTTLQVGASLYDGLNPKATGASDMSVVPKRLEAHRAGAQRTKDDDEYQLDRRCRRLALEWARSDPLRVAQLAGIKVLRTWNIWPNEPSLSSWPIRLAVCLTYGPVLLLGLIGAGRTIRSGWPYILCWLPAVYFTLLHAVFVGSIRYRQPAMLGLIVLAAGVVGQGGRRKAEG